MLLVRLAARADGIHDDESTVLADAIKDAITTDAFAPSTREPTAEFRPLLGRVRLYSQERFIEFVPNMVGEGGKLIFCNALEAELRHVRGECA